MYGFSFFRPKISPQCEVVRVVRLSVNSLGRVTNAESEQASRSDHAGACYWLAFIIVEVREGPESCG
eukprot:CAMPEP_0182526348 /NCGR_PEP_ID=MMETSP1323-20130603/3113_1 /TAXON_ID=236787 /ORGANISM="Florenciella parvula, Strain RCC1693" /LENGTH=66 /DNA_ID=CAMNT_0024735187 /DNA_START=244 /DNA_END=444 /DNA_ORIENTATION=-